MTLSDLVNSIPPGVPWCATAVLREAVADARPVLVRALAGRLGLREDDVDVHVVDDGGRDSFALHAVHLAVVAKPGTWQGVSTALLDRLLALLPVDADRHPNGSTLLRMDGDDGVQWTVRCGPVYDVTAYAAPLGERLWPEHLHEFGAALRVALGRQR